MKNRRKLIIISLIIFILATIASTCWYISLHSYGEGDLKNLTTIITQIGLFGGFFTTVLFLLINFCWKIKDRGLKAFLVAILVILFIVFVYQLTLNMIFYQTDNPHSFISYFFGLS
ncbi:hypothetical protein SAMN05421664_0630 [Chryseobacterium soldanellicola]|uniref:Uncharacterized protein n=1 Tax=Chryseobacterium soldanellicola TaxID=311333 RepID=A0A1H0YCG5_9FLAO|nr:hypothetical protein [Chryseobacterium soldanellicola]SDQ12681.1 hypothetical protein SAMN05421664_0630 [Chryseobacterium soldanellicola]